MNSRFVIVLVVLMAAGLRAQPGLPGGELVPARRAARIDPVSAMRT